MRASRGNNKQKTGGQGELRILLLSAGMDIGGAETHVLELARSLSIRGHSVTVASSGGRLAQRLSDSGVGHVTLPLSRRSLPSLLRARLGLWRLVKKGNFDIVHAHSRLSAFLASGICRSVGARLVTTAHARYRESGYLDRLSRWGSGAIAVSYDLYKYLLTRKSAVPLERIAVIPNGIDTERFAPTEKDGKALTVAFLSRLDDDCSRGAFSLCRIAERLAAEYGEIQIRIGGGGSRYAELKKLAEQVNTRLERCFIVAEGNIDDTADFLSDADVFVGVSRAALEAMSCGVPVVLAGDEGFLGVLDTRALPLAESTNFCARGSAAVSDERLFLALRALLDKSAGERASLGRELREYVKERHSVSLMAEQTERFYLSVARPDERQGGVLLCGYYGFGNMGDDLLLLGAVRRTREKYGNIALRALTENGKRDSDRFCVSCASRKNIFTLIRRIKKADTVVFGGGTLLQNDTSRRSLFYYLFVLRLAQMMGKRAELWGNGIGEIKGRLCRRLTARALASCGRVGVRDRVSFTRAAGLLCEYGYQAANIELERDLAAGYLIDNAAICEALLEDLGIGERDRIAVAVVKGAEDREALERFALRLGASGMTVVVAVMYPSQDMKASEWLCRRSLGIFAYPLSPTGLFSLIKRARVVCSMRYHALVLAADAGTPFIGFGNEEKIKTFCKENGGAYFEDIDLNISG